MFRVPDRLDRNQRPVVSLSEVRLEHRLDRRQRDHLSADLDEALQPPLERHAAIGVHRDEVARAIPGLAFERDERRLARIVQIAAEDARPAHEQHAGVSSGHAPRELEVHDGAFDRRHQLPDGAWDRRVHRVHRDDRRALGDAVPFEHDERRPTRVQCREEAVRAFLGARHGEPQAGELAVGRHADDAAEECRRAEQHRGLVGLDHPAEQRRLRGVRVKDGAQPEAPRQDARSSSARTNGRAAAARR